MLAREHDNTVCTISTLEIARLLAVGAISLSIPLGTWIAESLRNLDATSLTVTHKITTEAYTLPSAIHKEPGRPHPCRGSPHSPSDSADSRRTDSSIPLCSGHGRTELVACAAVDHRRGDRPVAPTRTGCCPTRRNGTSTDDRADTHIRQLRLGEAQQAPSIWSACWPIAGAIVVSHFRQKLDNKRSVGVSEIPNERVSEPVTKDGVIPTKDLNRMSWPRCCYSRRKDKRTDKPYRAADNLVHGSRFLSKNGPLRVNFGGSDVF